MKRVIVIGAGGHAKVVIDALLSGDRKVLGATDQDVSLHGKNVLGVPVIGDDSVIGRHGIGDVTIAMGIGIPKAGNDGGRVRRELAARLLASGYEFPPIVHPGAIVGRGTSLGRGAQVMAGAILQPGVVVSDFAIINTSASVDHDCHIGQYSHIAPGATLGGSVRVGVHSLVGLGASVAPGVQIGDNCFVAAGATVGANLASGEKIGSNAPRAPQ